VLSPAVRLIHAPDGGQALCEIDSSRAPITGSTRYDGKSEIQASQSLQETDLFVHFQRMLSTLVMTVIGPDRPGLVELVTANIVDHGGNWLESRMCRLGGQFAGIVRVEIPVEKSDALLATLAKLEEDGLQISARKETSLPSFARGTVAVLELVGQDRPGILHQISRVLAQHSVNVEELSSDRINAPMDGSMLFQARISVLLPATVSIAQLRSELETIATDLMVDVQFHPAGIGRK